MFLRSFALPIVIYRKNIIIFAKNQKMTMKTITLLLALIATLCASARQFVTSSGIKYRQGVHERCALDIYHPAVPADNAGLPVVVWFHGGSLTGGFRHFPDGILDGKYVIVSPSYRLIPEVTVNECIDDAAAALAWTIDSIAAYGGDPSKIFVTGHSAGGYLTSMIGLDKSRLAKYGKDPDSLAGLIPFSGQVITHFSHRSQQGISTITPTIDETAPLYHVRKDCPPYVIISGDRELELFGRYEENAYMWRMMKLQGHPYVRIYELDGFNHGDMAVPGIHILKNEIHEILKNKE